MKLPKSLQELINHFERLPGIGPKSAARLAFYILKQDKYVVSEFANTMLSVKENLKFCTICYNISEDTTCQVCNSPSRNKNQICVVENVLNLIAVENTGYQGVYHVLGGALNPINGVNAENIKIEELIARVRDLSQSKEKIEIILATNPTMEGESTAMFIKRRLEQTDLIKSCKVTRIGRGLPTGADIEFADKTTLDNALMGRIDF